MALAGQVSQQAKAMNDARDDLRAALHGNGSFIPLFVTEQIIDAIERLIEAKLETPRY